MALERGSRKATMPAKEVEARVEQQGSVASLADLSKTDPAHPKPARLALAHICYWTEPRHGEASPLFFLGLNYFFYFFQLKGVGATTALT